MIRADAFSEIVLSIKFVYSAISSLYCPIWERGLNSRGSVASNKSGNIIKDAFKLRKSLGFAELFDILVASLWIS